MLQKEMSGWDTNFYAGSALYPHLHAENKPPEFLKEMMDKKHLGMKTRHGLWEWTDEGIAREKARIEKNLQAALQILKSDFK
jgi:3-hydroxybutyryl-CoA dehydrogenase